ncbi:TRAP transporter small permease [Alloyangia pacifica]|uniref:TRAP transporter small permease n=1 Tax=Alloyangia pacifica TaxID=311180 RepID=UPI001CFEB483|nr:TRAP transporter small permease [Alloyangia pacifica]
MLSRPTRWLDLFLQIATIAMIVALACVVLLGVAYRYSGQSLIWYDEVAAALLAWITFTGAALAVVRNSHMGFNGLMFGLPGAGRFALFGLVEVLFLTICLIVVWAGWAILEIFGDEVMTTVRFVPRAVLQGVLPVSFGLMILGRLLTLPERLKAVRDGVDPDTAEIEHEIARAEAELAGARDKSHRSPAAAREATQ